MKKTAVLKNDAASGEKLNGRSPWLVILAVAVGTFMGALDTSVVNIALPSIGKHFGAPLYIIEWVVMSYLLVISSLLLTYGRLGDMFGHKRIYVSGFVIFTVVSLLCGLAPTISMLIVFRAVQALGAGMMMAMGPAIVTDIASPQNRGRALGVTAVAVAVAATAGPVVGGFLTTHFGWQSIFYINLPIGIAGTIWAYIIIPESSGRQSQTFDIMGAALVFFALLCLLVPLSYTERFGWRNPYILLSLLAGLLLIFAFVYTEKRVQYPMVDLGLFRNRLFTMSNISALINYMAQFSVTLLMPFYLQQLRGLTPSEAGFMLIPMPIITMVIAPISGALSDRFDSRYISSLGMAVISAGIGLLSTLDNNSANIAIMFSMAVVGLGSGLFQTPNNSAIMGSVPGNMRGVASGMLATMRNMGMVLGVAVTGAIFTSRMGYLKAVLSSQGMTASDLGAYSFIGAFRFALTVASTLAATAVLTSLARGSTKKRT